MPRFSFCSLVASAVEVDGGTPRRARLKVIEGFGKQEIHAFVLGAVAPPLFAQRAATIAAAPDVTIGLVRDPALAAAIAEISAARIRETDSTLVSFGTRHTMSDTLSNTRGIGAARRYLFAKLSGYSRECGGCLRVEYDPAMIEMRGHPDHPIVNVVNVLAWLPGRDTIPAFVRAPTSGRWRDSKRPRTRPAPTTMAPARPRSSSSPEYSRSIFRAASRRR